MEKIEIVLGMTALAKALKACGEPEMSEYTFGWRDHVVYLKDEIDRLRDELHVTAQTVPPEELEEEDDACPEMMSANILPEEFWELMEVLADGKDIDIILVGDEDLDPFGYFEDEDWDDVKED